MGCRVLRGAAIRKGAAHLPASAAGETISLGRGNAAAEVCAGNERGGIAEGRERDRRAVGAEDSVIWIRWKRAAEAFGRNGPGRRVGCFQRTAGRAGSVGAFCEGDLRNRGARNGWSNGDVSGLRECT